MKKVHEIDNTKNCYQLGIYCIDKVYDAYSLHLLLFFILPTCETYYGFDSDTGWRESTINVVVSASVLLLVVADPLCTRRFKMSSEPHAVIKPAIKISNDVPFPGMMKIG